MRYNSAKFHHCGICVTDFREGGLFAPSSHPWAAPKKPIPNRIKMISKAIFIIFKGFSLKQIKHFLFVRWELYFKSLIGDMHRLMYNSISLVYIFAILCRFFQKPGAGYILKSSKLACTIARAILFARPVLDICRWVFDFVNSWSMSFMFSKHNVINIVISFLVRNTFANL